MSEKFNTFGDEEIKKVFEKKPDLELTNRDDDLEESVTGFNLAKGRDSLIENEPVSKSINRGEVLMLNEYGEKKRQVLESVYQELSLFTSYLKTENFPKEKLRGIGEEVIKLLSDCDTNLSIQASHHYRENKTDIEIPFSSNESFKNGLKNIIDKDVEDLSEEDFDFLDKLETIVYGAKMQFSRFLEKQSQEN